MSLFLYGRNMCGVRSIVTIVCAFLHLYNK